MTARLLKALARIDGMKIQDCEVERVVAFVSAQERVPKAALKNLVEQKRHAVRSARGWLYQWRRKLKGGGDGEA